MSYSVVVSPTGIVAPSYADILAGYQAQMRTIFGQDIYLDADSQDGQMLAIFAKSVKDVNDAIISSYNSFSPATAQGVGLSTVIKINGLKRLVPTNSQVVVAIGGTVGTVITNGQVKDQQGNIWNLPASVTIPIAGTINVTATAATDGAIAASIGTVNIIATPTRGWQSVTNSSNATPGDPVETDAELRQRQGQSTAIPALTVLEAMYGALKNVIGVGRLTIYENPTNSTDANGVPAHSISPVIEGGDVTTVATIIAKYKTPGTGTYGTTAEVITLAPSPAITINFYELTEVELAALVYLTPLTGYVSTTATLIQGAIANWLTNFAIGMDSPLSKLWSPVNLTGDAAVASSGQSQDQLDALGDTYNATAIYQARKDNMILTAQTTAGNNTFHLTSVANYANGNSVAIALDNGSFLLTTISNIAALVVTTVANVPGGRTANIGALMYVQGDVIVAFNEGAMSVAADTTIVTP